MKKKPTIDDVAALAGVGRTTVSRVLNDGPHTSKKVREKVARAVDLLGYEINLQAKLLAGGKGRQVVLVHAIDYYQEPNSYYGSALEIGALRACVDRGCQLNVPTVITAQKTYTSVLIEMIESGRCDMLLLTPPLSDDLELLEKVKERGIPAVAISPGSKSRDMLPSIGINDERAGYDLTKHLLSLGHRRIGFLLGPEGHRSATERYQGFERAHLEFQTKIDDAIILSGDFTFRSGIELAKKVLELKHKPTALMCGNDDMAAGALLTAHRMELKIPGELSITGFDNTPMSEIMWPPLTTINQPIAQMGYQAVEMALSLMSDGKLETSNAVVSHSLVCRESVARLIR